MAIGTAAAASRSASRCRRDPASRTLDSTRAAGSTWDAASTNSWPPLRPSRRRIVADHPSISWHEPTAVDPESRTAGQAVVRLQVLDVPLSPTGDAAEEFAVDAGWTTSVAERFADRVIAEAAQHISGLEQTVVGRHILSPADLARTNPNAGPGRPRLRTQRALPGVHPATDSGAPRRIRHRRT